MVCLTLEGIEAKKSRRITGINKSGGGKNKACSGQAKATAKISK